jgi:hypothetical protein
MKNTDATTKPTLASIRDLTATELRVAHGGCDGSVKNGAVKPSIHLG